MGSLWQSGVPFHGCAAMLVPCDLGCPYCAEPIEILVDVSAGEQQYIEDCQVCCRPIVISVVLDAEGSPVVRARSENEA